MTDNTSTPTVELRLDNTHDDQTWDEHGQRTTWHRRDVRLKVTGADPIPGFDDTTITPDLMFIRWQHHDLAYVRIEGRRHKADGTPGVRTGAQMFSPAARRDGLPLTELPAWAATALAGVEPGDTDKAVANLREALIIARAESAEAARLATEAEESGEDDGLADAHDIAADAWQTAGELGERLDQALTNGAPLPIAWRQAEQRMTPAEIKAAATAPRSVAERVYNQLSDAERVMIADQVFELVEFEDGEPGNDGSLGDLVQDLEAVFAARDITLTDPNHETAYTLPGVDGEPAITYHLLPGTNVPNAVCLAMPSERVPHRGWLEENAIRRTQQCDECGEDIDMANTSEVSADHAGSCSLYADNDAR